MNNKSHVLAIVKVEFWKKPTKCMLAYKIIHFEYKCAPKILELENQA